MEGKEVRLGAAASALFAASTTGTSTGAVVSSHDSFTPGGGGVLLVNMLLGEVSPGGVGAGLYGMLVFVLLAVFISGLMVGRTPEYLGKKVQAAEMKLVVLYLIAVPDPRPRARRRVGAAGAGEGVDPQPRPSRPDRGRLRLRLSGQQQRLGLRRAEPATRPGTTPPAGWPCWPAGSCSSCRCWPSPARWRASRRCPPSAGTLPTHGPLFVVMLLAVVVIVIGLTYFPVLALGPDRGAAGAMTRRRSATFDPRLMRRAVRDAVLKLDPRRMVRNPVMFVVEVTSVLVTVLADPRADGVRVVDRRLAVVHGAVRQLRRGDGRGAGQGAGRDASPHALRDDRPSPRRRAAARRRPVERTGARTTSSSSRPGSSSPPTARSSRASPASTSRRSPASRRR